MVALKYVCNLCNHLVETDETPINCGACTDHTCMFEEYLEEVPSGT